MSRLYTEREIEGGRGEREVKWIKRGKMAEVKDPKIKLFGKTIELPETSSELAAAAVGVEKVSEAAQSCDAAGEDSSIQDPPCSSDSMLEESNWNGDAEDQESDKV